MYFFVSDKLYIAFYDYLIVKGVSICVWLCHITARMSKSVIVEDVYWKLCIHTIITFFVINDYFRKKRCSGGATFRYSTASCVNKQRKRQRRNIFCGVAAAVAPLFFKVVLPTSVYVNRLYFITLEYMLNDRSLNECIINSIFNANDFIGKELCIYNLL